MVKAPFGRLTWDRVQSSLLVVAVIVAVLLSTVYLIDDDVLLLEEPPIGQIPTGKSVLVDDGTCPTWQVKQVIGSVLARIIHRGTRSLRDVGAS